ncbi:MAG: glycoside hydrolase family 32 protein [Deltaproteobacteria bacterium]|nr:glycoside hydrolase family 32 protein [Deltaproteobacteria bacterium]
MTAADKTTSTERYAELYRPRYHFSPERGWLSDPNGLIYLDGEWHVFFQHNPDDTMWGNLSWGHAVSTDLVNWQHLPVALRPHEQLGFVFSGSAVADRANSSGLCSGPSCLVAVFTHAFGDDGRQKQSIAVSGDGGRSFVEHAGNPVLPNPDLADFRDPKVLWHAPTSRWVMALAAGDRAHIYTSTDLKSWTKVSELGPFAGLEGAWECPDLFPLQLNGVEKWVFKLDRNVGLGEADNHGFAMVGSFDGVQFVPETTPPGRRLDYGPDFYAAQLFNDAPNGRRVWLGWRDSWQYALGTPTDPWRGSMSVPRELALVDDGAGPQLIQTPVAELRALRGACPIASLASVDVPPSGSDVLAGVDGDALEISLVLEPMDASSAGLAVRRGEGEETRIGFDRERGVVFVDRSRSGDVLFASGFGARFEAPVSVREGGVPLTIFVDRASVEVFADGGRVVLSVNVYPLPSSVGLAPFAEGGPARLRDLEVHRLANAAFTPAP